MATFDAFTGFEQTAVADPWTSVNHALGATANKLVVMVSYESATVLPSTAVTAGGTTLHADAVAEQGSTRIASFYLDSIDSGWPAAGTVAVVVDPSVTTAGYVGIWSLNAAAPGAFARFDTDLVAAGTSMSTTLAGVVAGSAILSGCAINQAVGNAVVGEDTQRFIDDDASGGQTATFADNFPGGTGDITHTWSSGLATRRAGLMVEVLTDSNTAALDTGGVTLAGGDLTVLAPFALTLDVGAVGAAGEDLTLTYVTGLDTGTAAAAGADLTIVVIPVERVPPDVIIASTNLVGTVGDIDEGEEVVGATLFVAGGTLGSPTALNAAVADTDYTVFILGDGHYNNGGITRSGITIVAQNQHQAIVTTPVALLADDVTIDGLSRTAEHSLYEVHNPGCQVLNCYAAGFAQTGYANGIWVFKTALSATKHTVVSGCLLEDCGGGDPFWGAIAVGHSEDDDDISDVRVTISDNTVIGNQTTPGGDFNASLIQILHPANVYRNVLSGVVGAAIQNKTRNSHVMGNTCSLIWQDGALYNRVFENNVWEYNLIHDCDMGVDHFRGNNCVYRGNVIYDCGNPGRIKVLEADSHDVTIEDNTFYNCDGGWIWDTGGGGTFDDILWRRNIWHTVTGAAIATGPGLSAWDETDNLFYLTTEPVGTTGAGGTSDADVDPQFVGGSPFSFVAQAPEAVGRGAPWPLPIGSPDVPNVPDNLWLTASDATADTVLHVGFETPGAPLLVGAGLQKFRLWVRKTTGIASPTLAVDLYEDGALVAGLLAGTAITSATEQLVEAAWDADLLAQVSGSGAELRAVGTAGGAGTPGALPAYDSRGALSINTLNGTASRIFDLPNVLAAGDVLLLVLGFVGGSNRSLNSVTTAGWHILGNFGGNSDAIQLALAYRVVESSAESDGSVSCSVTGTSTTPVPRVARLTAADGFAVVPIQNVTPAVVDPTGTSLALATVAVPTGNCLAGQVVVTNVNASIGSGTGESGGNWNTSAFDFQNASGAACAVSLQLSDQSGGGTISGGTVSWSGSGAAISVGFAIVPASAGTNTVEFGAVDWMATLVDDAETLVLDSVAVGVAGADLTLAEAVQLDTGTVEGAGNDVLASGPITLDTDSVAVAGADLVIRAAVNVDVGSVVLAGNDLLMPSTAALDAGAVAATGNDLTILQARTLTLDAGTVAAAGSDADFDVMMALDVGAATVAGNDLAFLQSGAVTLDVGTVAAAGNDLLEHARVTVDTGSAAVAGNDVEPKISSTVALDVGSVAVLGADLVLAVVLDTGAVAVAGNDMVPLNGGLLTFDVGAVAVAGADALLSATVQLDVHPVVVNGEADLSPDLTIALDPGVVTVVNEELGVFQAGTVTLDTGAAAAFSNDLVFLGDRVLALDVGVVAGAGQDLSFPVVALLDGGALSAAGADLTLSAAGVVTLDAGGVGVAGEDVAPGYLSFTLEDGVVLVAANDLAADQRVALDAGAVGVVGQVLADRVAFDQGAVGVAGNDMAPSAGFPSDFEHGQHFPGIIFSTGERFEVAA